MKEKYEKNNYKEIYLKMSLLDFKFVMICINLKILVLHKNHLNYPKYKNFECFFRNYNRLLFLKMYNIFFITYNDEKSRA